MFRQLLNYWEERNSIARVSIVGSLLIIVVGTFLAIAWVLATPRGVLFSELEPQSAAGIVSGLEQLKVDYEISDGGSTILVDEDVIHDTRLKLMGNGVQISGGIGFELFDETEFGMTEFTQRINYQRALQGELSRTISSLREVKHARVHLVLPERSLFKKEQESPTASVILFANKGAILKSEQITGIQRLVASSVPTLKESMVTVINDKGVTLSREVIKGTEYEMADLRLQKKKEIEQYFIEKVSSILRQSVGSDNAAVSVDVTLNYDKIRTTNERIVPNDDGSASILRKHESRTGGAGKEGKQPQLVDSETEYKYGRVVEQIIKTPGSIERLSIGVLISADLSKEHENSIKELIAASIGLNDKRGDLISVKTIGYGPQVTKSNYPNGLVNPSFQEQELVERGNSGTNQLGSDHLQLNKKEQTDASLLEVIFALIGKKNTSYLAIVLVALIAISAVIIITRRRADMSANVDTQQLTDHERERVLRLLQEWMSDGEVKDNEASL